MVSSPNLLRSNSIAVHVAADAVEILVPRSAARKAKPVAVSATHCLLRFEHELDLGESLASAIIAELRAHGIKRRPVVLGFQSDLVHLKIVEIPAIPQKDLAAVIARRVAALAELQHDEVTFSAQSLDGEDVQKRRWLISGLGRSALYDMQHAFRGAGFPVRHAVAARTAPFVAGAVTRNAIEDGATITVIFEGDSCAIGVLSEGRLVHASALQGGATQHLEEPQTARAFIQELRGIDAFWRRTSRGQQVAGVLVGGMDPSDVERLGPAVVGALGDVEVKALSLSEPADAESETDATLLARMGVLATLGSSRMSVLDFSVELRPRALTLTAVATASACLFGALAFQLREDLLVQVEAATSRATTLAAASTDLPELEALSASVRNVETMVMEAALQIEEVSALGLPAEALVSGIVDAFGREALLLSVSGTSAGLGDSSASLVRLRGIVRDAPGVTAPTLQRLKSRLEAIPGVEDVQMATPRLGADGPADAEIRTLDFSAVLRLEGGEPQKTESYDDDMDDGGMDG